MTSRNTIALAAALALAAAPSAYAQSTHDYWIAGVSTNGPRVAAVSIVDAQSIAPTHDHMKRADVWLFVSPLEPNPMAGSAFETSYEYDCDQHSQRFLGGVSHNQDGSERQSQGESQNWHVITPNSIAEGALGFVCSETRPTDALEIGNASPLQTAQHLFADPQNQPTQPNQ